MFKGLLEENQPLSEQMIKDIHYLVLADKKMTGGIYRRVPVRIMEQLMNRPEPYMIGN